MIFANEDFPGHDAWMDELDALVESANANRKLKRNIRQLTDWFQLEADSFINYNTISDQVYAELMAQANRK